METLLDLKVCRSCKQNIVRAKIGKRLVTLQPGVPVYEVIGIGRDGNQHAEELEDVFMPIHSPYCKKPA